MTNFIVPIDFSVDSLKGLQWAILFSRNKQINIQMVYVLSNSSSFHSSVANEEQKYAETQFKKLLKEYEPVMGNQSRLRYIIKSNCKSRKTKAKKPEKRSYIGSKRCHIFHRIQALKVENHSSTNSLEERLSSLRKNRMRQKSLTMKRRNLMMIALKVKTRSPRGGGNLTHKREDGFEECLRNRKRRARNIYL